MTRVNRCPGHPQNVNDEQIASWRADDVDDCGPGNVSTWKAAEWNGIPVEHIVEKLKSRECIQTRKSAAFLVLHGYRHGGVVLFYVVNNPGWGVWENQPDEVAEPHDPS